MPLYDQWVLATAPRSYVATMLDRQVAPSAARASSYNFAFSIVAVLVATVRWDICDTL